MKKRRRRKYKPEELYSSHCLIAVQNELAEAADVADLSLLLSLEGNRMNLWILKLKSILREETSSMESAHSLI